jgi:hypothetical protein
MPAGFSSEIGLSSQLVVNDNTQPSVRVGRKAYRVLKETAGLPKYHEIFGPGFFIF